MTELAKVVRYSSRALGGVQLALGLLFWTGNAYDYLGLHKLIGFAIVAALLVAAYLGARAGAPRALVALALGWCLVMPLLGLAQVTLVPGDLHWTIQLLHLAVGLAALGTIERLTRRASASRDLPQAKLVTSTRP